MKRIGTLLVFKPDVTKEQAVQALEKIKDLLDLPEEKIDYKRGRDHRTPCKRTVRPFKTADALNEYDDEYGGPTFYIP